MSLSVDNSLVCGFGRNSKEFIQTCVPDGHLYIVTYAICRIDTIDSHDDEHKVARNMQGMEINIYGKESCVKLVI